MNVLGRDHVAVPHSFTPRLRGAITRASNQVGTHCGQANSRGKERACPVPRAHFHGSFPFTAWDAGVRRVCSRCIDPAAPPRGSSARRQRSIAAGATPVERQVDGSTPGATPKGAISTGGASGSVDGAGSTALPEVERRQVLVCSVSAAPSAGDAKPQVPETALHLAAARRSGVPRAAGVAALTAWAARGSRLTSPLRRIRPARATRRRRRAGARAARGARRARRRTSLPRPTAALRGESCRRRGSGRATRR